MQQPNQNNKLPKGNIEKPKDAKSVLLRLSQYLFYSKWLLVLAILLAITSNLLALVGPMLSGYAIDAIEPGVGAVDFKIVTYYTTWMILFYILSSLFTYALSVLMMHISQRVTKKLRNDVFTKLVDLPIGYFDTHQSGDIISRISFWLLL
ncbi:MAG: multidrug transport system ATP-binding and permease protein [Anaerocolumna sp.]|nr:multidrug transport system ATP-binding and permease protein [Anaerocolumna sp.]